MTSAPPLVVLVACGLTDADRLPQLRAAAANLGGRAAVLQGDGPSLSRTLERLDADGVRSVTLVGVSGDGIAAGLSWVRRVAAHWLRTSGSDMAVGVVPAIARSAAEADVVAAFDPRPVTGTEAPLENPTWQTVQPYRRHVLVCRGPRCTAKGSDATVAALGEALHARGLLREDVLVTATGCLTPCNHSPVVVVHGDGGQGGDQDGNRDGGQAGNRDGSQDGGAWFGPVDADGARALAAHLAQTPCEPAMLPDRIARRLAL